MIEKVIHQPRIGNRWPHSLKHIAIRARCDNGLPVNHHATDLIAVHFVNKLRVVDLLRLRLNAEIVEHGQEDRRNDQPQEQGF